MINFIELQDVGPSRHLRLDLAPRLNVLTGGNGVGKSFLLDVAWWVAASRWSGEPATPRPNAGVGAAIAYHLTGTEEAASPYLPHELTWDRRNDLPVGVAFYAEVNGQFAIADEVRNGGGRAAYLNRPPLPLFRFAPADVWNGLTSGNQIHCNGLIRDWVSWQREGRPLFQQFRDVLLALSPDDEWPLVPGDPVRVSLNDARDIPTIQMPYGDVPVIHAAAGMRRILALAYLLVWTWSEHLEACRLRGLEPSQHMLVLVDEVETHLHPQWQRRIVPALMKVVQGLSAETSVQLIISTHAPLVLASLEPVFDAERDALYNLDLHDSQVVAEKLPFERHGDASTWLMSEAFGLATAYAAHVEEVIDEAIATVRRPNASADDMRAAHDRLAGVLTPGDPFWRRWRPYAAKARIEL